MTVLAVCLLVFTQLAVSAYACANTSLPGEIAQAATPGNISMPMADMPDCQMGALQQNPAICKAHCQKDAQSADIQLPAVQPPLLLVLFFSTPFAEAAALRLSALSHSPAPTASPPPIRIQYQVFRI